MMRLVAAILAAGLLSACNMVVSDHAILTPADDVPDWPIKPGIWVAVSSDPEEVCVFDVSASVRRWPKCAEPLLFEKASIRETLNLTDYGDRLVMAEVEPGRYVVQVRPGEEEDDYNFAWLSRGDLDADGRARTLSLGLLQCGPVAGEGTKRTDGQRRYLTLQPYPGAIIDDPNAQDCRPDGRAGLWSLVLANIKRQDPDLNARWVRPARPSEARALRKEQGLKP